METTLREIKSFDPCSDGWRKLCKGLGTCDLDTEVPIMKILEINGVEDAFWALRTQKYEDYCLVLADVAESILHIFEEIHPDDNRPRLAIQAIREYKEGEISKEELEDIADEAFAAAHAAVDARATAHSAFAAAHAAVDAHSAYVVAHAAIDAAHAAYAAAHAAVDAHSAYVVVYAAIDAAHAAVDVHSAYAAAHSAVDAAHAAVDADDYAVKIQRAKNEEILRSYLEGENHEN